MLNVDLPQPSIAPR